MADGEGRRARILVLGGTGFIGRNLVHYLVTNDLVEKVRVADKVLPQMAWMSRLHQDTFANPIVEFTHSNLINPGAVEAAFTDTEGFDFVINAAAETKYGQSDPVYKDGIVKLSVNCARAAASRNCKVFIELSSGQMHSTEKKPMKEDSKCDPWTHLAKYKLSVEQELEKFPDLNYIIVRPAIVYGHGDRNGLTPRLIIGALYKYLKEKMKMLWTKDVKMNTVHIDDVSRALWHLCNHGRRGEIYNLVDKGDTTQGRITDMVSEIFDINHDYVGSALSNIAKLHMGGVVEEINDKHMAPWAEACERDRISNTPLNPFIHQELLYNKHLYLDGSKLEQTGFRLENMELRVEHLREILEEFKKMGLFPPSLLSGEIFCNNRTPEDEVERS